MTKTTIGIVDDHNLIVKSLSMMISNFADFEVIFESYGGSDMQEKLAKAKSIPEIMLIDVNMPGMDGFAVARWLTKHYPAIKLIALSMNNDDLYIIKMIRAGCCAYLFKTVTQFELEKALIAVNKHGYYNGDININRILKKQEAEENMLKLTDQELHFILLACSDNTYQLIAKLMVLSESRVDDIRASVFVKLDVKSRVAMAMEAIKRELVKL